MRAFLTLVALALGLSAPGWASEPVDARAVAEHLAASMRFRTISHQNPADFEAGPFEALHGYLRETYPRTFASLRVRRVGGYSLLLEWPGKAASLQPVLFMSHTDVVPVEPGTEDEWTHPAFDGVVADGVIWGRGAVDNKNGVIAWLEAVERLLAEGFVPKRTVYFAFGHDEEVGGHRGAGAMAALLREEGVRFEFILDEGGFVVEDSPILPGRLVAMVNIAEKTYFTVYLRARGEGGHSSTPPRHTAIGKLASALHRLEAEPMPARLSGPIREMFAAVAPEMSGVQGWVMRNLWLTEPLVLRSMRGDSTSDAMVRTTTAITIFDAGVKENVLPQEAVATVNFRLLPGDSPEEVLAHIERTIDDPEITIEERPWRLAPEPARTDTRGFDVIRRAVHSVHPDAVVVPGLVTGATDTLHYADLSDDIYRFLGARLSMDEVSGFHGTNERTRLEAFADAIRISTQILRLTTSQ
ncbi:MAG: M20 family peptidase [Deltaproteobacteria bacterium]|nr:M20 family peptidase [Deltaproteobacteria bacterium]MBW2417980.1 M20 family peptidase [Deltaproteobacteria bacterium]